jgi:hypothetical protein
MYKLFLPQRYTCSFMDDDIQAINDGIAVWNVVSKGRIGSTNSYQLTVEEGSFPSSQDMDHAA